MRRARCRVCRSTISIARRDPRLRSRLEHVPPAQSGERVAQLVAEHRQEFVFGAVRVLGLGTRGALALEQAGAIQLDCLALPHQRGNGHRQRGDRRHEGLQHQQRLVVARHHEGSDTTHGRPGGDQRDQRDQCRDFALSETKGSPHQRRNAEERQRITAQRRVREYQCCGNHHHHQQRDGLDGSVAQSARVRRISPEHEQGCNDHGAGGVTEPPGKPDGAERAPRRITGERQRNHSDRRADRRAEQPGQQREAQIVARALEGPCAFGITLDQQRAHDGFQRVADCNPDGELANEPVVMLTRKAPTRIAGQICRPKSRSAPSAIPVGGQTGVALTCTKAKCSASLPARK